MKQLLIVFKYSQSRFFYIVLNKWTDCHVFFHALIQLFVSHYIYCNRGWRWQVTDSLSLGKKCHQASCEANHAANSYTAEYKWNNQHQMIMVGSAARCQQSSLLQLYPAVRVQRKVLVSSSYLQPFTRQNWFAFKVTFPDENNKAKVFLGQNWLN